MMAVGNVNGEIARTLRGCDARDQKIIDDVLIALEAMKMELPIRAPRDGVVKAVHCQPGELVQPGQVLLDLE